MSLSLLFNKTPMRNDLNTAYKTNEVDLNKILNSRFIGEGVYAIEVHDNEQYIVSPSFSKWDLEEVDSQLEIEGTVYELEMDGLIFMPLDTSKFVDMIKLISKVKDLSIFMQILLCKRQDNWRDFAIDLYEEYLLGNNNPFESKLLRNMQRKIIDMINMVGSVNTKKKPIEEVEKKILQNNYRFECRFVVQGDQEKFVDLIKEELKKLILFNELKLKLSEKGLIDEIKKRRFKYESQNQLLSEEEVYSLLLPMPIKKSAIVDKKIVKISNDEADNFNPNYQNNTNLLSETMKILPIGKEKDLAIDKEIINQIEKAFSRVKISKSKLKVLDVKRGARLQKIELKIPDDKNYSDIKKNVENIQAVLGKESFSIEIGDKPETINLFVTCDDHELIYLSKLLGSNQFQEYAKEKILPFVLGEDVVGNPLYACLSELRHLLIAGATGSGKSVFLNGLLLSLLLNVNPEELNLYLIDPKIVEMKPYTGFPQVKEVITDMNKASKLLNKLTVEMDSRYEILAEHGYRDVMGYNKKHADKIPYIVCVIDEYADLVETNNEVESDIQRLGQKARGAGIHLVIATQRPSSDILDGAIKTNMPSRISFKLETSSDYKTIFGKGIPFEPLGRGDGCARIEGTEKTYTRFQAPIITLDDEEWIRIIENLKYLFKNNTDNSEGINLEMEIVKPEEKNIDKIKRIIANTGETRIAELQKQMGIRINIVSSLMKELVLGGWLEKNGNRYEVVVSDEELNKWKIDKES